MAEIAAIAYSAVNQVTVYIHDADPEMPLEDLHPRLRVFLLATLGMPDDEHLTKALDHAITTAQRSPTGQGVKLLLDMPLLVSGDEEQIDPSTYEAYLPAEEIETKTDAELKPALIERHKAMFDQAFDTYQLYVNPATHYLVANQTLFDAAAPLKPERVHKIGLVGMHLRPSNWAGGEESTDAV